jgi:transcription initiation factor IIE alpha subunit
MRMSTAMIFKCPGCGGYLEFDPSMQKFKCRYCGQELSEEELRVQSGQREAAADAVQEEQKKSAASEKLQS